ncbi:septation protein SepH [Demequina phytophila]|uniref:septation protein SepH n=1 Tax=Demequina phytophila TaxID=1638981 RepID=UPI00225E63A4|nr:septation protein SepH [Demequina phytophila]
MTRLTLVGPSEDGLHLVVEAESGDRFELPLTDELRHAVRYTRRARRAAEPVEEAEAPTMTPREIQQRIRSGLTAAELAELTGMSLAAIEKYEGPVAAERQYIADLARETRIGRDPSAPQLGELVTDRLAARGVDPESVTWDAWRETDEPWRVAADYRVSGRGVRALWTFDHTARTVTAEDEEARWLSETELLDVPIPRRHLSAVGSRDAAVAEHRPACGGQPHGAAARRPRPASRHARDGRRGRGRRGVRGLRPRGPRPGGRDRLRWCRPCARGRRGEHRRGGPGEGRGAYGAAFDQARPRVGAQLGRDRLRREERPELSLALRPGLSPHRTPDPPGPPCMSRRIGRP